MSLLALALALSSAFLHAIRDFLIVRSPDKTAFSWLLRALGLLMIAPVALLYFPVQISATGWILIVASALTHSFYALSLARAYETGALSVVYPIARSAPIFVVLWSVLIWRESFTLAGLAGVSLVVLGAFRLQASAQSEPSFRSMLRDMFRIPALRFAWLTALLVATYSLIDDRAVASIDPVVYLPLYGTITCALMLLLMGPGQRAGICRVWSGNRWAVVGAAIASLGSYLLALYAMRLGNVGYVVGIRQVSILFSVLLGWLLLKESQGKLRVAAACLMIAGIVLMGFA